MNNSITIVAHIPFEIGTLVYKKSDLEVLRNYTDYIYKIPRYKVVGYECSFVSENKENTNSKEMYNLKVEIGNVILKKVYEGQEKIDENKIDYEYCYHYLLTNETINFDLFKQLIK